MFAEIKNFAVDAIRFNSPVEPELNQLLERKYRWNPGTVKQLKIQSRTLDARSKRPQLLYNLLVELPEQTKLGDEWTPVTVWPAKPQLNIPEYTGTERPVILGTGPAGIFAAWILAQAGAKPVILERGPQVEQRTKDWAKFLQTRELNPDSNLLIGEGGAGTFSDGKLFTRVRDEISPHLLQVWVDCGAPEEILYLKHPHIGSDRLGEIAINLRHKIEQMGGEFHFNTQVTGVEIAENKLTALKLADGRRLETKIAFLAHGLGGRELTNSLVAQQVEHQLKGFQIGCRIEHPQKLIDSRMYHVSPRPGSLGAAEYNLVSHPKDPALSSVSTFCMCPGGNVLMASAWPGQSCSNGMSNYRRDGKFANSCLIVTLPPERFASLNDAYEFLHSYEHAVFAAGGGDYTMPAQSAAGFLKGEAGLLYESTGAITGVKAANLDELLPKVLVKALAKALRDFESRVPGFIAQGQLVGFESCVSSPVSFVRRNGGQSSVDGLYLLGEGAGCAGGIMSAAIDGARAALNFLQE